jgi:hypothetical protein
MMLITGKSCPKCELVKKKLPETFTNVVDIEDVEAIVALSMRDLRDRPLSLPVLLLDEDEEPNFVAGDAKRILDIIITECLEKED